MSNRDDDLEFEDLIDDVKESVSDGKESTDGKEADDKTEQESDKESEYEDVCFICRRPESKAGRMFKLPNHISVCSDCMHKTMDTEIGRAHV